MNWRFAIARLPLIALLSGCEHATPPGPAAGNGPGTQVVSFAVFDSALLSRLVFEVTNRQRAAHGMRPLAASSALDAAADDQAWYMALAFHAQHENPIPGERDVSERVARAGLGAARVAENVIMEPVRRPAGSPHPDFTYAELAAHLVDSWMESPGHRANILNPQFTGLGCAARVAHGVGPEDQRVFAAQVFLENRSDNAMKTLSPDAAARP